METKPTNKRMNILSAKLCAGALVASALFSSTSCEAFNGSPTPPDARDGKTVSGTIHAPANVRTSPEARNNSDGTAENACFQLQEDVPFENGIEVNIPSSNNGDFVKIELDQLPAAAQKACNNRSVIYVAESRTVLDN